MWLLLITLSHRRVNPVEELYAAWPSIMTLNPDYGRYILEPLMRSQRSAEVSYAAPDLGMLHIFVAVNFGY